MTQYSKRELSDGFTYRWKPKENGDMQLKITKSSMGTFLFCPAAYDYSYRQQIRGSVSDAMIKGNKVHNVEESFWEDLDVKKAADILKGVEKGKSQEAVEVELQCYVRETYKPTKHEGAEEIVDKMAVYYTQELVDAFKDNTLDGFIPVGNEVKLDSDIEYEGVGLHLQGIIDRIFQVDDYYVLMELKTGLWKDNRQTGMRKEMAFYKILVENASDEQMESQGLDPNIPIKKWGWYYPASNYVQIEDVKKQSEKGVWNSISKMIVSYYQDNFEFKWFWKKCLHCGHVEHCEATGKKEGGEYDWF